MRKFRENKKLVSEINVTPFVDVALVLLIIFMVTAPMMQEGIDVNLPQEKGKEITIKEKTVVSIRKDEQAPLEGKLYLNDVQVTAEALATELETKTQGGKANEAFIRADKEVPYGYVVKIMAIIKDAGIDNVGLVVTAK